MSLKIGENLVLFLKIKRLIFYLSMSPVIVRVKMSLLAFARASDQKLSGVWTLQLIIGIISKL